MAQLAARGTGWTAERMEERLHQPGARAVDAFRATGYRGVTPVTRELLEHWTAPGPRATPSSSARRGPRDGHLPDRATPRARQPLI